MAVLRDDLGASQFGARALNFLDFHAYGAPEFFGKKDFVASKHWVSYMDNVYQTSFYPKELNVRFASSL